MKQKQKMKHLENPYCRAIAKKSGENVSLQEDLQGKHTAVAAPSAQTARAPSTSSSEYFSCVSSEGKLTGAGPSKLQTRDPQHGCSLKDSPLVSEAKSVSSESEYFSCYSSLGHLPSEVLNTSEDVLPLEPAGLAQGHSQMAEDSNSEYFSCVSSADKLVHSEFWKSQEEVPQPESSAVVPPPPSGETAEEKSSASEYFSCVSSVSKLIPANEHGVAQTRQDVSCLEHTKDCETSSPFPHVSFPFHLVRDPKHSVSSVHMEEEEFMKVYYTRVQMKRGVAVLCDPEEGLEPLSKKIKIEEVSFPAIITHSPARTKELLSDSEYSWNNEAQEEREEADSPPEPPAVEECPRAKTPEWLMALDSGFRCMACCRVFPSLEVLQEHVKHGVSEGFSCHTFHLALTWLKNKKRVDNKRSRQMSNTKKTTCRCQKEKHFGMKLSSYK